MIIRTVVGVASLYIWGDPRLDSIRPLEIDQTTQAVREILDPAVAQAMSIVDKYIPDSVRYASVNHPILDVGQKLGKI